MFVTPLDEDLAGRLLELERAELLRSLRRVSAREGTALTVDGVRYLNFSSNDYLGLAGDARLREASARAARDAGVGSGASRLVCGDLVAHEELECLIAALKGTEAALSFSSGFAAALGCMPALVGAGDAVILDKLSHACLVDAARLSGAQMRVFRHNDLGELEERLRWAAQHARRALVVVESLYSMDGDRAPLRQIVELKERYGAWLWVDEAHSTGIYGAGRSGLCEEEGVRGRVEVQMGTLSKAVGASGGFIAGGARLREWLINRARSFIYSTAPCVPAAAAATEGLRVIASPEGEVLRARLWENQRLAQAGLSGLGLPLGSSGSPILPLIVGGEGRAMELAARLRAAGLWVPAIRYPTVARGQARLRVSVSAAHTAAQIEELVAGCGKVLQEVSHEA